MLCSDPCDIIPCKQFAIEPPYLSFCLDEPTHIYVLVHIFMWWGIFLSTQVSVHLRLSVKVHGKYAFPLDSILPWAFEVWHFRLFWRGCSWAALQEERLEKLNMVSWLGVTWHCSFKRFHHSDRNVWMSWTAIMETISGCVTTPVTDIAENVTCAGFCFIWAQERGQGHLGACVQHSGHLIR